MGRKIAWLLFGTAGLALGPANSGWCQPASGDAPLTYELLINGESFLVQGEQMTRLESREHPGVVYQVALRIAPTQTVRLERLRFDYRWPARVTIQRRGNRPSANLRHELGYTLLVADLGGPMEETQRRETMAILKESALQSFTRSETQEPQVAPVEHGRFQHTEGEAVVIRYRDEGDVGHVVTVYVLTSSEFSCYVIAHYLEVEAARVEAPVKAVLNSIRDVR